MPQFDLLLGQVLRALLLRRIPEWARYAATFGIVLACGLVSLALPSTLFLPFVPGLLVASILLGRGPGLLATVLSAVIAVSDRFGLHASMMAMERAGGLGLFFMIGFGIAVLGHTLRSSLISVLRAEREKSLLLEELRHRIKNNLQQVASLLSMQSRAVKEPAAAEALQDAAARVQVIAKLHDRLQPDGREGLVNMRDYLDALCSDLGATLRALRPVSLTVSAEPLVMSSAVAGPVGLIVNELVTNCFKYAFPEGTSGLVSVTFEGAAGSDVLTVRDNGIGTAPNAKQGQGTRLTDLLVEQIDGRIVRSDANPGFTTTVTIPRGVGRLAA